MPILLYNLLETLQPAVNRQPGFRRGGLVEQELLASMFCVSAAFGSAVVSFVAILMSFPKKFRTRATLFMPVQKRKNENEGMDKTFENQNAEHCKACKLNPKALNDIIMVPY